MPRMREEQMQLDRRLLREVKRQSPAGIEAALRDGADPNTTIEEKMPLDVLTHTLEQRKNWLASSWVSRTLVFVSLAFAQGTAVALKEIYIPGLDETGETQILSTAGEKARKYFASVSSVISIGTGALFIALRARNQRIAQTLEKCVGILCQYGADPTLILSDGRSAFDRLMDDFFLREKEHVPLILQHMLSDCKDQTIASEYIKTILDSDGKTRKIEALLEVLVAQNPEMARAVLPESGEALLHLVARRNDQALVKLLLKYGHDPSCICESPELFTYSTPKDLAPPGSECEQLLKTPEKEWFQNTIKEIRKLKRQLLANYDLLLCRHGYTDRKKNEYITNIQCRVESIIIELEGRVICIPDLTPRDRALAAYLLRGMEILCGETLKIQPRIASEGMGVIRYAKNQFGFTNPVFLGNILRDAYSRHIFPPRFPEYMQDDPVAGRMYRGLSAVYINIAMTPKRPPGMPARQLVSERRQCYTIM